MRLPSLDKLAFGGALLFLTFIYGIATQAFGWFPSSLVREAWNQAEAISFLSTEGLTGGRPPQWSTTRVYDRSGVRIPHPDEVQPGPTLLVSAWRDGDDWTPGLRIIDRNGELLHHWSVPPEKVFPDTTNSPRGPLRKQDIQGTYLFPNGDVLINVEYVGAARLNACGRVQWQNSRFNFHHSVARDSDGTFWIPGVIRDVPARSERYPDGYPGLRSPIHRSLIVHVSEDGEVLGTINVMDVLYQSGLHRHIPQAMLNADLQNPYGRDVVHMNDVEPLPDSLAAEYPLFEAGDLVVSLRRPHLVFVMDPETREVRWHETHPFIHQHDPDYIGDGWIGVFDNNHDGTGRGEMLGGSRIVFLNPQLDSTRVVFPTSESEPFYTDVRGKWQLLQNGNMLLTEAEGARAVEVAADGRTVWEWIHEPSDSTTVPAVTEATRLSVSREQIASWPCSPGDSMNTGDTS